MTPRPTFVTQFDDEPERASVPEQSREPLARALLAISRRWPEMRQARRLSFDLCVPPEVEEEFTTRSKHDPAGPDDTQYRVHRVLGDLDSPREPQFSGFRYLHRRRRREA
jgi:hypothetical protein